MAEAAAGPIRRSSERTVVEIEKEATHTLFRFFNERVQLDKRTSKKYAEISFNNDYTFERLLELDYSRTKTYLDICKIEKPTFGVGQNHRDPVTKALQSERSLRLKQLRKNQQGGVEQKRQSSVQDAVRRFDDDEAGAVRRSSVNKEAYVQSAEQEDLSFSSRKDLIQKATTNLEILRQKIADDDQQEKELNERRKAKKTALNIIQKLIEENDKLVEEKNKLTKDVHELEIDKGRLEVEHGKIKNINDKLENDIKNLKVADQASMEVVVVPQQSEYWTCVKCQHKNFSQQRYCKGCRKPKLDVQELRRSNEALFKQVEDYKKQLEGAQRELEGKLSEINILTRKNKSLIDANEAPSLRQRYEEELTKQLNEREHKHQKEIEKVFRDQNRLIKKVQEDFEAQLQEKDTERVQAVSVVTKEIDTLKSQIKADTADYQIGLQQLEEEKAKLENEKTELEKYVEEQSKENEKKEKEYQGILADKDSEFEDLKKQFGALNTKLVASVKKIKLTEDELQDTKNKLTSIRGKLQHTENLMDTAETELEETREKLLPYELDKKFEELVTACLDEEKGKIDEILDYCIANKMDILEHDVHGWTPLLCIAKSGSATMVRFLVQHGANIDGRNELGWTPLMWACWRGQVEMAEFLLGKEDDANKEVDINERNKEGKTALILACENRQAEVVKLLIDRGADVSISINGKLSTTAVIIAYRHRGDVFREFLGAVKVYEKEQRKDLLSRGSAWNSYAEQKHNHDGEAQNGTEAEALGTFWSVCLKIDESLKGKHKQFIEDDGSWNVRKLQDRLSDSISSGR